MKSFAKIAAARCLRWRRNRVGSGGPAMRSHTERRWAMFRRAGGRPCLAQPCGAAIGRVAGGVIATRSVHSNNRQDCRRMRTMTRTRCARPITAVPQTRMRAAMAGA